LFKAAAALDVARLRLGKSEKILAVSEKLIGKTRSRTREQTLVGASESVVAKGIGETRTQVHEAIELQKH
jgi:hypothetical protein